jgi:hypothetical protein
MEILISIDGVIRNKIQKFDYHYKDCYFNSDTEEENPFEYGVSDKVYNDSLFNYYKFQSNEEYEFFTFIEYPIEIFGHAGLSYPQVFNELHNLIRLNPEHNFTIIGLDEFGKAKPATLFFLSKNGFVGNNIKFIKTDEIENTWDMYDTWITDNEKIISKCPTTKNVIKFNTIYNDYFNYNKEINKLNELTETWSNFMENTTSLILKE